MKKIITAIFVFLSINISVFANNDTTEVSAAFQKYITAANSYSNTLPDCYTKNAKIIRVVNKKQGGQQSVVIPFDRYLKELNLHSKLARTVKYKNSYINQKITKVGNDYKVSATRVPRNDKKGLPCYFIYTQTSSGWKIREESMTTNVQTFLSAK